MHTKQLVHQGMGAPPDQTPGRRHAGFWVMSHAPTKLKDEEQAEGTDALRACMAGSVGIEVASLAVARLDGYKSLIPTGPLDSRVGS
ncbi:hypothetical protein EOD39_11495 [Acipenser ruthenus]|uniref:Uncharacterized protein n=1 Tax=Acipenser ruthenus TaxID=7906 RepID=A0A662YTH1_ACIRT|nr:hypothetical protein EOD39_11495 [Acipenser ruthenus]